jgi:hypothetical protein
MIQWQFICWQAWNAIYLFIFGSTGFWTQGLGLASPEEEGQRAPLWTKLRAQLKLLHWGQPHLSQGRGCTHSCSAGEERSGWRAGHLGPWEERGSRSVPQPSPALPWRLTDDPGSFAPPHLATLLCGVTPSDLSTQVWLGGMVQAWPQGTHTPLSEAGLWVSGLPLPPPKGLLWPSPDCVYS